MKTPWEEAVMHSSRASRQYRNMQNTLTGTLQKRQTELSGLLPVWGASLPSSSLAGWQYGWLQAHLSLEMPSECSWADWPVQSLCPPASRACLSQHYTRCDADGYTRDILLVGSPRSKVGV